MANQEEYKGPVNCGLCGKPMGQGDQRAKHFHMACCERAMDGRRNLTLEERKAELGLDKSR